MSFNDKIIIVTGAGSGISRSTAIALSELGVFLLLADISLRLLQESSTRLAPNTIFTLSDFDVSSTEDVNNFISLSIQKYSHIDHVFNCAGINPTILSTAEIDDAYWNRLVDTNLKGVFNMTRACIPHMPPGSSFVNVSSTLGLQARAGMAVYCATKFAVIGFSKAMALELGPQGIRVNVVAPGYIDTPSNSGVVAGKEAGERMIGDVALGRLGIGKDVASGVIFLMSEGAGYMNGSVVEVSGGRR